MTKAWPFPGDAPVVRAKKMCLAYRNVAQQQQEIIEEYRSLLARLDQRLIRYADPALQKEVSEVISQQPADPVGDLDRRFAEWGQRWHAEVVMHHEMDDIIPAKEAAALIQIAAGTLGRLRMRGRIKGQYRGRVDGYYYRVRDVYALSSELRSRKSTPQVPNADPTDTVTDSRSSAAK